jgi:hypothetical protein
MPPVSKTNYTWSYSSLDLFKQCPHKYYRLRVVKDLQEPESEPMRYGKEVHLAAEEFIRDGKPIPDKFGFMRDILEPVKNIAGKQLCEYRLGLTRNLEPCEFFGEGVWWRGIPDFLAIDGDKATLLDYKTGKSAKYADTKQLELLALAIFKHFPEVNQIKAGLLFVVAKDFVKAKYNRFDHERTWVKWLAETSRLEQALELNVWNPKPNFSCKSWCIVTDCIHNGRGNK